ncbi:MAG: GyrI-like domain-containing protein [Lachnospiraceae bacterium]|nr:GyrI-like domain-containing protein [Lachnospiraceae bacterium]
MVEVRIEEKPEFRVCGKKVWISGQNNEEFSVFWKEARETGLVERLKHIMCECAMERSCIGVSRVEKDPADRAFFFYIACETDQEENDLESFTIPAAKWAVFSNHGKSLGEALVEAELFCHFKWLKTSGYVHAMAPEMEVYPERDGSLVEYWLPIEASEKDKEIK